MAIFWLDILWLLRETTDVARGTLCVMDGGTEGADVAWIDGMAGGPAEWEEDRRAEGGVSNGLFTHGRGPR